MLCSLHNSIGPVVDSQQPFVQLTKYSNILHTQYSTALVDLKARSHATGHACLQGSESTSFKVNKPVHGDVTIGIWLGNHKRDRDVPALAYQFHTALLDTMVGHNDCISCVKLCATEYSLLLLSQLRFACCISWLACCATTCHSKDDCVTCAFLLSSFLPTSSVQQPHKRQVM